MHHDAVARVEVDLLHDRAPKTAQRSEYPDDAHAATCLPRVSSPCQLETLGAERRAPSYITLSDPRNPQERPINRDAEGVEVGVHRGLSVDGTRDTVDFDPSASNPGSTAMSVESLI